MIISIFIVLSTHPDMYLFSSIFLIAKMLSQCAVVLFLSLVVANERPSVTTKLGDVNGYLKISHNGRTYSAFEGIPFAQPPVGKLRFEPPMEPDPWEKPLDANKTYACSQNHLKLPTYVGSEDCLYLNVYVPKDTPNPEDNMNVIVHIHGGGFKMGESAMAGPHFFMDRDVVYVNLNYRLGAFGFLSTEDSVVPGNNGLKDQTLALQWVQNNIKQFGGNPNSVTITGSSAGAGSVHFHYFSKMSKGLFHRGISQSGTALAPWAIQKGALKRAKTLALLVGCKDTSSTRSIVDCLKGKSEEEILEQTTNLESPAGNFPLSIFAPIVERKSSSAFLDDYPYQLLTRGEFNDLPWVTSLCTDEGSIGLMYLFRELDTLDGVFNKFSQYYFDYDETTCDADKEEIAQKIREQYFGTKKVGKDTYKILTQLFGDRYFGFSFEKSARTQARNSKSKVYSYVYGYKNSFSEEMWKFLGMGDLDPGVGHADDTHLMYDVKYNGATGGNAVLSEADEIIKDFLIDMFISFADSSVPIINGVAVDPVSNSKLFTYVSINSPTDTKMNATKELTPTKFWEGLPIVEYEWFSKESCNKTQ